MGYFHGNVLITSMLIFIYADGKNVYSGRKNHIFLPPNKDVHVLITGNWEYVPLYMPAGGFAGVIQLWIWGDYSGLPKRAQCNYEGP